MVRRAAKARLRAFTAIPETDELRSQHEKERERLNAECVRLNEEYSTGIKRLRERETAFNHATRFIPDVADAVKFFTQSVALAGEWGRALKDAIADLRFDTIDSWKERGDVEILRHLLQERLSVTGGRHGALSPSLNRILGVVGEDNFRRLRDSEIVATFGRKVREALKKPNLPGPALRAHLRRIREACDYPSSEMLRRKKAN